MFRASKAGASSRPASAAACLAWRIWGGSEGGHVVVEVRLGGRNNYISARLNAPSAPVSPSTTAPHVLRQPAPPLITISQHLTVLRKSGLLRARAEGLTITYWLDQEVAQTGLRRLASYGVAIITCPVCGIGNGCGCVSDK
jgi:hypothetical protein